MSIFSFIKDKIFGHKPAPAAAPAAPAAVAPTPVAAPVAAPAPVAVDVEAILTELAAAHEGELHWKTSIVDLMKLLGMDSSLANRKELATELGYTGEKDGSAEMNIWLIKAVWKQLAEHGGHIPANLMD